MPSSRDRLHPNHLPEFVAYAATRGYEVELVSSFFERRYGGKP